jgi:hypothetical protein
MSSARAPGGSEVGGLGGSSGRKRGRPLGSRNKDKGPAATPSVSCKRGRPLGSRNKKTLAALAAAAATASADVVPATATAMVPVEAATAVVATAASVGAAPPSIAAAAADGSAGVAADAARKPRRPPVRQRLSYTLEHGFTTFVAPLRAGYKVRLPLPFRFVDTMGGTHWRMPWWRRVAAASRYTPSRFTKTAWGKAISAAAGRSSSRTTT